MTSQEYRRAVHSSNDRRRRRQINRSRRGRAVRLLFLLLLLGSVAALALVAGLYVSLVGQLPSLEAQETYVAAETTKIYAEGDPPVLLAEVHGVENREIVDGDQIPHHMRDAVVAIEDERFYSHPGVDLLAILRALYADLRHGEIVQGGSTITQQYIKNAYISDEKTINRKVTEAALAYQLERQWSKDKILNAYLNTIYFGEGAYGVEAAAREYFGVHAEDLSVAQAALLAGVTRSPANYSPRRDASAARERRNLVLNKMFQQGYIDGAQLREALATPIELSPRSSGQAARFPYWVEMVREQLMARYGVSTVLQGGLRVYTSIDLDLQVAAEETIAEILDQPGDPAASLITIDLASGRIVAMVGGADFEKSQFNLAIQAHRQPGSAFKPFVLLSALQQGIAPTTAYESGPLTVELPGEDWQVKSADYGEIDLYEATAESVNGVYARLVMEVGPNQAAEMARQLGIESPLDDNPALALGGLREGVSPLEMASAYATIATGGYRLSGSVLFWPDRPLFPIAITRVEKADGTLIDSNHLVRTPVIDPRLAYTATDIMRGVINGGTGSAANIGRPAAGKTGTTQEYRDAWFVGYTPEFVTAVWIGYPDEQREMLDVHGVKVGGGSFPARIWAVFMKRALADVPVADFPRPAGAEWVTVAIDPTTGLLATQWCPERRKTGFFVGEEPTEYCYEHQPDEVTVADVVGMTADEARAVLVDTGLAVAIEEQATVSSPVGVVVRQDPPAGSSQYEGTQIRLTVAKRPDSPSLPNVVGNRAEDAQQMLEGAGYRVVIEQGTAGVPPGTVVQQIPGAGTALATGEPVTIVVSVGPGTTTTHAAVVVPDVVGQRLPQAITQLESVGLRGEATGSAVNEDPGQSGRVAAQTPGAGTSVAPGTIVDLTVFAAP